MAKIADDFRSLLPPHLAAEDEDDRPVYVLWTFDPDTAEVYMDHNEDKHPAHHVTHTTLAPHVHHPEAVHGFAYSIEGGWRITNDEHSEVKDPYVVRKVVQKLREKYPEEPLPHIPSR